MASATAAASATFRAGGALLGDGPFEGEVTFRVKQGETTGDARYRIKDAKVRLEIGPNGGAAGGAIVYDAERYQGAVFDADGGLVLPLTTAARTDDQTTQAKIERTGKSDTVAGYVCELWKVQDRDRSMDACVVDGVAWGTNYAQLVSWLPRGKFFVLRVIERDGSGKETTRIEATSVVRKPQSDALFVVPVADAGAPR
jgi:hypothetical protein